MRAMNTNTYSLRMLPKLNCMFGDTISNVLLRIKFLKLIYKNHIFERYFLCMHFPAFTELPLDP